MYVPIKYRLPILALLAIIAGCGSDTSPVVPNGNDDPLARAISGLVQIPAAYQGCDIGIALRRRCTLGGVREQYGGASGCIAFQKNGYAMKVASENVNGISLPWHDTASEAMNAGCYWSYDSLVYGAADSMSFAYSGFDGQSFSNTIAVAPSFGKVTLPDTIFLSKGFRISWSNPVRGDSISVAVSQYGTITIPDTGGITFGPNVISYDSSMAQYGYTVNFWRVRWSKITSPAGKKIGVWSLMESDSWPMITKP